MQLNNSRGTLATLGRMLDAQEPLVIRAWRRHTRAQAKLIDTEAVRHIMSTRALPQQLAEQFRQMDSDFIADVLEPRWQTGLTLGGRTLDRGIRGSRKAWDSEHRYTPNSVQNAEWEKKRKEQIQKEWERIRNTLIAAIASSFLLGGFDITFATEMSVTAYGLTPNQWNWVERRFNNTLESLVNGGMDAESARMAAQRSMDAYESYLLQWRAQMIARTELSAAFHQGQLSAVYEAQENGWIGRTVKVWTAFDGCCDECAELDGTVVELEGTFEHNRFTHLDEYTIGLTPPLHPNCRCTLTYETE